MAGREPAGKKRSKRPANVKITAMSLIKKVLLIFSLALFIILLSFSGLGLYLYYNPEKIKPMIERALSSYTGSSYTV